MPDLRLKESLSFDHRMLPLGPFESAPTLAVAVSGGADSLALCLLAQEWAKERNGNVIALTVDHGLRTESSAEARQVGAWLGARGIEHHILTLDSPLPSTGIQDAARRARYDVLTRWCRTHRILHLLLAHHRGDQAETILLRQERGSGPDGLAGMAALREWRGVRLMRPLLGCAKEELTAFLNTQHQDWIRDPSNQDMRYTRTRLRAQLADAPGLAGMLSEQAQHAARERAVWEHETARVLARHVFLHPWGYGELSRSLFSETGDIMQARVLSALAQTLGGMEHPPRSDAIELLRADLPALAPGTSRSFGGCLWMAQGGIFRIFRALHDVEAERDIETPDVIFWDGRFEISVHSSLIPYRLSALGPEGLAELRRADARLPSLPAALLHTLPALRHLEDGLIVPHIKENSGVRVAFRPAKSLAGPGFYCNN